MTQHSRHPGYKPKLLSIQRTRKIATCVRIAIQTLIKRKLESLYPYETKQTLEQRTLKGIMRNIN